MHIVVVSHGFQEHYTLGFANALARHGLDVVLIRSSFLEPSRLDPRIRSEDLGQNTGERIAAWSKARRFLLYHLRLLLVPLRVRGATIHVIGLLRHEIVTGLIEGLAFRWLARRYVLTVHNLLPHDRHTRANAALYRLIYRIPHQLVVHTDRMRRELETRFGVDPQRILLQEHGLNDAVPDHGWDRARCRSALGVPANGCVLLFFGRIAPYKGLDILLDAFARLRGDYVLLIAGEPVSNEYGIEIDRAVRENARAADIVYRRGWIEDGEIATLFRASDCLVMPYRHIDQSGLVFLALRFATPVVSFDVGSVRDYVGSGNGVIADGSTADALADAIRSFAARRAAFSTDAVRAFASRFDWDNVTRPLLDYYRLR